MASVAGNPITLQAYKHWMYIAAKGYAAQAAQQGLQEPVIVDDNPNDFSSCVKALQIGVATLKTAPVATLKSDCKNVFQQYNTQILSYLIETYWIQAQAHKLGISTANLKKDFPKYLKTTYATTKVSTVMKDSGETRQDLYYGYVANTLYAKLLKREEKPVDKKAIAAFYAAHKSEFGTPESRDLHMIRTKTQAEAQAALNALKSGQSWNTVAKTYSADPSTKANGGLLTGVTSGMEESAANTAIFGNPVNKLVGPIKGIFGYYVLQVIKIHPKVQQSLAASTATIKADLTETGQQTAQAKLLKLAKAAWLNKTTCRSAYAVATFCPNYQAPKTTTTAPPTVSSSSTTSSTSTTGTKTATTATKTSTTKK